jgi:L-alanine-DL-glutamate epimerase-like enolase superfamily enzyme
MKITGVRSTLFTHRGGAACAVELLTDEPLIGVAIVRSDARAEVAKVARECLVGEDPRAASGLWQRMVDAHAPVAALSALDAAVWDLKAKANDEPMWKTVGGSRPRIPVHASSVHAPANDDALVKWCETMAGIFGCRAGKLQAGDTLAEDLRRLGLMQQAFGKHCTEPALSIDAGESWSPKEAIRRVREMEKHFDLRWVEAPTRRWDFLGLKRIADAIRAAVCVRDLSMAGEVLPHLHHHSLNILAVSAEHGGITGALQKADAAFGFELPVVLQESPGNLNAHLAGALPNCMSLEVVDPASANGIVTTDVRIEEGWACAGDAPGNGLQLDRKALGAAA